MDDLTRRFAYHPATTPQRRAAHEGVRTLLLQAAIQVQANVPPGREQALALTKLEEAMFWANAAIARQPDPTDAGEHLAPVVPLRAVA